MVALTPAEVKVLKKRVEALKFSASETPEKWSYKMQLLLNMWKRIPADKRGGAGGGEAADGGGLEGVQGDAGQ